MSDLKTELTRAYTNGKLFEFIHEAYYQDRQEENLLPRLLSELHNDEHLDLIEIYTNFENSSETKNFFTTQRTFEEVLPSLNASVSDITKCIKHLALESGQNFSVYAILPPFKSFCQKSPDRAEALFKLALSDIDQELDYLSIAIEAGATLNEKEYIDRAINLLNHKNELIRQRATLALGRIDYQDKTPLDPIIAAIINSANSLPTDKMLSTAIQSLFSITKNSKEFESLFLNFLEKNSPPGDLYIHASSEILFRNLDRISPNIESRLLEICSHTRPDNTNTISNIDYALERLLRRNKFNDCIDFLENIFKRSEYKISIKSFDGFIRELHKHRDTYLSSLITRWLLSKKLGLGRCCYELTRNIDKGISIRFDTTNIPRENNRTHIFLAKKACAWFFNQPKTAISLIESLIIDASEADLADIQSLIFNPLFISYPSSIYQRMNELKYSKNERVAKIATNVLSDYEIYQDSLKAALEVSELIPNEQDRHTYWKHHNKLMDESMKKARSKSVFASLFAGNESVLLYGNKSIHYIHHGDKETRQEFPLQKISHSFELASLHNLDPHGLEHMIWQYKTEGCTS